MLPSASAMITTVPAAKRLGGDARGCTTLPCVIWGTLDDRALAAGGRVAEHDPLELVLAGDLGAGGLSL
jgi:hypothetical protein